MKQGVGVGDGVRCSGGTVTSRRLAIAAEAAGSRSGSTVPSQAHADHVTCN